MSRVFSCYFLTFGVKWYKQEDETMKTKTLWLIWLYLFCFSCVLGFIPEPPEFVKALLVTVGVCFFIPGALLLKKGQRRSIFWIRVISISSLVLTLIALIVNFSSVLITSASDMVFYALHILLGILSTPMFCCQVWVISLFGWACLLAGSFFTKKQ